MQVEVVLDDSVPERVQEDLQDRVSEDGMVTDDWQHDVWVRVQE